MKKPCSVLLLVSTAALLLPLHEAFKIPIGARLARTSSSSTLKRWPVPPSSNLVQGAGVVPQVLRASDAKGAEGDSAGVQPWIEPAFHNKLSVRILAVLAGISIAMKNSGMALPKSAATYIHLLMFGANFGSVMYTTFVLGLVMIKHLPRQTFGRLQSKLFPIYFAWSALALALQLLTGKTLGLPAKAMRWLAASLAAALINSLFLEPASTKVMFQRYALEKQNRREETEYKELAKRFGALHGASSLVNLVTVVGGFVHAYYLSLML